MSYNPYTSTPQQAPGFGSPAQPQLAGVGARFGAMIIDRILTGLLVAVPVIALWANSDKKLTACQVNGEARLCEIPKNLGLIIAVGIGLALLLAIFYWILPTARTGQTFGKKMLGVRVVDRATGGPIGGGRAFGRGFVSLFSNTFFGLGFLWAIWDANKQTWHDKAVNSIVVKV